MPNLPRASPTERPTKRPRYLFCRASASSSPAKLDLSFPVVPLSSMEPDDLSGIFRQFPQFPVPFRPTNTDTGMRLRSTINCPEWSGTFFPVLVAAVCFFSSSPRRVRGRALIDLIRSRISSASYRVCQTAKFMLRPGKNACHSIYHFQRVAKLELGRCVRRCN